MGSRECGVVDSALAHMLFLVGLSIDCAQASSVPLTRDGNETKVLWRFSSAFSSNTQ